MSLAVFQAGFTTLPRAPLAPFLPPPLLSHPCCSQPYDTKVPFVRLVGMIDELKSQPASKQPATTEAHLTPLSLSLPPPSPRMIMLKLCQSHKMFGHEGFLCK
jgi:hypothetical protein